MKSRFGLHALGLSVLSLVFSVAARAADAVKVTLQDAMVAKIVDLQKKGVVSPEAAEELLLVRLSELEKSGRLSIPDTERKRFERDVVELVRDTLTGK